VRISKSWLSDYVDLDDISPERFEDLITTKVAEVDDIELCALPTADAILVKVLELRPHAQKTGLQIVKVSDGKNQFELACGATNIKLGVVAAYLAPGSRYVALQSAEAGEEAVSAGTLAPVTAREISGFISPGFLASEAELGLTSDHSGLFLPELTNDTLIGQSLSEIVGPPDIIIVIDNKSLTHRPDLWSHFGFARELSAILKRPLKIDQDRFADCSVAGKERLQELRGEARSNFSVRIDPLTPCARFTALEIGNVRTVASPLWMRFRLAAVGAGVRNLLVDLSNYVMCDIGQPNHAYDADKLSGDYLVARFASSGEAFTGLDGIPRELASEDLVIATKQTAVALAGVIGGQASAIQESTSRVLLESATFDPVAIRHTTKRHSLRTDASNRFEKSQSPYSPPLALHRFWQLLSELQPQARIVGEVSNSFPAPPAAVSIPFSYQLIRDRLGVELGDLGIKEILEGLRFTIEENNIEENNIEENNSEEEDNQAICHVPYHRATRDVSIAADLVEEVGRIYGYDEIAQQAPLIVSEPARRDSLRQVEDQLREALRATGFSECYLYSFQDTEFATRAGFSLESAVRLQNPIDANLGCLRVSLIPGLLQCVERNFRYTDRIALFELGRAYSSDGSASAAVQKRIAAQERRLLTIAWASQDDETQTGSLLQPELKSGAAFYSLLGLVRDLLRQQVPGKLNVLPATIKLNNPSHGFGVLRNWMHPHRQACLDIEGVVIGVIAEVSPALGLELPQRSVVCEIDLDAIRRLGSKDPLFQPLPRFPDSFFEMSIIMPNAEPYQNLAELLALDLQTLPVFRRSEVLAVYEGAPIPAGKKSVSVKFVLGSDERTLASDELKSVENMLIARIVGSSYELRR